MPDPLYTVNISTNALDVSLEPKPNLAHLQINDATGNFFGVEVEHTDPDGGILYSLHESFKALRTVDLWVSRDAITTIQQNCTPLFHASVFSPDKAGTFLYYFQDAVILQSDAELRIDIESPAPLAVPQVIDLEGINVAPADAPAVYQFTAAELEVLIEGNVQERLKQIEAENRVAPPASAPPLSLEVANQNHLYPSLPSISSTVPEEPKKRGNSSSKTCVIL